MIGIILSVLLKILFQILTYLGIAWIFARTIHDPIYDSIVIFASLCGFGIFIFFVMKGISVLRSSNNREEGKTVVYISENVERLNLNELKSLGQKSVVINFPSERSEDRRTNLK